MQRRAWIALSSVLALAVAAASVQVEFGSAEEARSFVKRLLGTGVLERFTVTTGPTVVEMVDSGAYELAA